MLSKQVTRGFFVLLLTILVSSSYARTALKSGGTLEEDANNYCYDDHEDCGPSHWPGTCQVNTGRQSPIDITIEPNSVDAPTRLLRTQTYSSERNGFQILNNGHSIQLSLNSAASDVVLSYGDFGDYYFQQLHFHWGAEAGFGSEHTVKGSSTPMEIHLVHYLSKYPDFNTALESDDPNSLAVIGVRVEGSVTENEQYQSIVNSLRNVSSVAQVGHPIAIMSSFDLDRFLPSVRDFFAYEGSLTTPPCSEEVQWIFLKETIKLSWTQIAEFRTIHDTHNALVNMNYRPVQPLGDRKVEFFRAVETADRDMDSAAGFFTLSSTLLLPLMSSAIRNIFI